MSVLQDLAAGLRAGSEHLPVNAVIAAADRLTVATELLAWVRRSSPHPMGVPQLTGAVEHLENAVRALLSAQDDIEAYLVGIGVATVPGDRPTGEVVRRPVVPEEPAQPDRQPQESTPLDHWWALRVDRLTGAEPPGDGGAAGPGARGEGHRESDPAALLRTVAERVRSDDRSGLRAELRRADPPVGLGLAAISPAALRRIAGDLLGHAPTPDDLKRLREATGPRLRELLPGLTPTVSDTLLARVCRVPPDQRERDRERERSRQRERDRERAGDREPGQRPDPGARSEPEVDHPADAAVGGAVLVGLLLHRLGRSPDSLTPELTRTGATRPEEIRPERDDG